MDVLIRMYLDRKLSYTFSDPGNFLRDTFLPALIFRVGISI